MSENLLKLLCNKCVSKTGWFVLLSLLAYLSSYYRMLTGFPYWDDEGFMMMTVKEYLSGAKLYNEVLTGYGPVYYFFNAMIHGASHTPVSHDVVRIISGVEWALCPLVVALITYRLTQSVVFGSLSHVLSFRTLILFRNEPGHPQELCMVLFLVLVSAGLFVTPRRDSRSGLALLGVISAALLLVKVNCGAFSALAVGIAVFFASPLTPVVRIGRIVMIGVASVVPTLLMRVHFNDYLGRAYCIVATLGVLALVPSLIQRSKNVVLPRGQYWLVLGGWLATVVAVMAALLLEGVSLGSTFSYLVLGHIKDNIKEPFWYLPPQLGTHADIIWPLWAVAGFILAVLIAPQKTTMSNTMIAVLQFVVGAGALVLAVSMPDFLVGWVTPYCWLVMLPPSRGTDASNAFGRTLLSATAVLQTLYAYPMAGSQALFINVILLVTGCVCLADGLTVTGLFQKRRFVLMGTGIMMIFVVAYYGNLARKARNQYFEWPPLSLPGAELIHVPPADANALKWLVATVRQNCDIFWGFPGLLSLYFWTDSYPPSPFYWNSWPTTLGSAPQEQVIRSLAAHPMGCVIYSPHIVDDWNTGHQNLNERPLVRYIWRNYQIVDRREDYYLLVRKDRPVPVVIK